MSMSYDLPWRSVQLRPVFWACPGSILVQELSRVYRQNCMRPKLLIAVLVLALSGTNSNVASMCAVYCMSSASAGGAAVHHHQMESQPRSASISHHMHAHHKGAECPECPPTSGNNLNQKADCASFVQFQALKEASFSFDAPRGGAHVHVVGMPALALALASDGERFLPVSAPNKIRSFNPVSAPLRI